MKRVSSTEAKQLQDEGWTYLDVRSEGEFEAGHPAGAVNVPLNAPNFLDLVKAKFAQPEQKLVLGCAVGARSLRAMGMLAQAGYQNLAHNAGGFDEWAALKLPSSKGK